MQYKTSKDYEKLWDLAINNEDEIIGMDKYCEVEYLIIITSFDEKVHILNGLRESEFETNKMFAFISYCKANDVQFLDPEPPKCETCKIRRKCLIRMAVRDLDLKHKYVNNFGCRFHEYNESEA